MNRFLIPSVAVVAVASCCAANAFSQVERHPEKRAFFGETHMHTAYSLDGYLGGTRQTPSDAYRFAKGESVVLNGKPHRLRRPLDFATVTDHAEFLGEMYAAFHPESEAHQIDEIQQLVGLVDMKERRQWFLKYVVGNNRGDKPSHLPFYPGDDVARQGWKVVVDAAEEHNQPGVFTAFIGYEWTSAPKGANLHRNIIYRSDSVPEQIMSSFEIPREEALWQWLDAEQKKGHRALAIPHNSNASKGLMFPDRQSDGSPLDAEYASLRAEFERAIEIMQVKGNSEVHAKFWTADEFSDFENAPSIGQFNERVPERRNFVRAGLVAGLARQETLGQNPFKLGIVGGTDSHNGLMADVDEDGWGGGHGGEDATPQLRQTGEVGGWIAAREQSPGSITGVWASSNTRDDIWDAMYRRETFATSGPRIQVRLFAGWEMDAAMLADAGWVQRAYERGVPMGSDLKPVDKGGKNQAAPRLVIMASKDALGANLDRIQVVKGWIDANGKQHDKVFEAVWAGDRSPGTDGKLPPVGNTVDLETATYRNTIGAAELSVVWEDPEFDPALPALYYARVIQIPTPRWTTFDAVRSGLPLLENVAATIQERAWTSPVWYRPESQ